MRIKYVVKAWMKKNGAVSWREGQTDEASGANLDFQEKTSNMGSCRKVNTS